MRSEAECERKFKVTSSIDFLARDLGTGDNLESVELCGEVMKRF